MSTEFQREDRYIVIKRSDLDKLSPIDRDLALSSLEHVDSIMAAWDCPARKCLVIESDWPEYEPTWAAIEARVTGKPAEQHQGEPVAWQDPENESRMCTGEHKAYALSKGGAAALALATLTRPLYTNADPGEVDRLRDALDECDGDRWKLRTERNTLRAQLAELEALLHEVWPYDLGTPLKRRIKAALSVSAEPSKSCGACGGCPNGCRLDEESPSTPVELDALSPDEINQMAFEEGQPAEDGDGYTFTQEEFDLFVQRLLDRAALERKPAGADDLAAFNAAFQKAMEAGWDDPIDLARQLWNARGDLGRKPSALIDQLQADLTARDERMDRAEQVLRKVAKLRGTLEQHGLLEEIEELLRAAP
ncbi:hypothetical protein [Pseudomonas sp. I2]|uniref:hypothetical protein n=1 Tax=Pseudomonas sp. I2 TaxID=1338438 RepID=UPI0034D7407F